MAPVFLSQEDGGSESKKRQISFVSGEKAEKESGLSFSDGVNTLKRRS